MATSLRTARLIAWCAFALGVAASVAANVAHAEPQLGARLASAFAPVALLLTVEIMSRVPWPAGGWWRFGRFAGAGAVALVAAVTSYSHMYRLLLTYGETPFIAAIQPACVDGLMVVASLALLALGNQQPTEPAPGEAIASTSSDAPPRNTQPHAAQRVSEPVTSTAATSDLPTALVMSANLLASQHHNTTGKPIPAAMLADRLGVDAITARRLLGDTTSGGDSPVPARVNGRNPVGAVSS